MFINIEYETRSTCCSFSFNFKGLVYRVQAIQIG